MKIFLGMLTNVALDPIAQNVIMGYNGFVISTGDPMENNDELKKFLRGFGPKPETSYERALRSAAEFRERVERIKRSCEEEVVIEEQNGIL